MAYLAYRETADAACLGRNKFLNEIQFNFKSLRAYFICPEFIKNLSSFFHLFVAQSCTQTKGQKYS